MKKLFVMMFLLAGVTTKVAAQSEDEAIKATLYNYLDGGATGDVEKLNKAFYPMANLRSLKDGKITDTPVKTFIATVPQGGAKWQSKIVSYSYSGTAATAVTEEELEAFKFIDFLNLIKVNGEWKIVSRVFTRADKDVQVVSSIKNAPASGITSKINNAAKKPASKPKGDDGW